MTSRARVGGSVIGTTSCLLPHLGDFPVGDDAVVIATTLSYAEATVRDCDALGTKQWMHRAFGEGRVCPDAPLYCREHGMTVIDG